MTWEFPVEGLEFRRRASGGGQSRALSGKLRLEGGSTAQANVNEAGADDHL